MRLAIVHYHLRKGGVTRVIASALEALGPRIEQAVVLSSTEAEEPLPCPVAVVPELAYCEAASGPAAESLFAAMQEAARNHLGSDPDIWHIHNHSLGKNVNFPEAMRRLADSGTRLLLQIHDFAEDGRPGNYRAQRHPFESGTFSGYDQALYPVAPQIGYAVLNGRDRDILLKAGIPSEQTFWLPNAVTAPPVDSGTPVASGNRPLILYPTRAIRRKNLGEMLLLAAVNRDYRFATSLSPKNPQWAGFYNTWVDLAAELDLPVEFALGEQGHEFADLVNEAQVMLTTSVGEGFGLAFLEPWLFGKAVVGRDLPEITRDFRTNGIEMPELYDTWSIPTALFDASAQRRRFVDTSRQLFADYGRQANDAALQSTWETLTTGDQIDFGILDETAQAEAIRKVATDPDRCGMELPFDPSPADASLVRENTERIQSVYGLSHYGETLSGIYAQLAAASPGPVRSIKADQILDAFLDPMRLRLLRT